MKGYFPVRMAVQDMRLVDEVRLHTQKCTKTCTFYGFSVFFPLTSKLGLVMKVFEV